MSNGLAMRIREVEARMNQLKTLGLSSSSSLAMSENQYTFQLQIIGTQFDSDGNVTEAGASKKGILKIRTQDRQPALLGIRYISPLNFGDRGIRIFPTLEKTDDFYNYCYSFYIYGDQDDIDALNNGQTLPTVSYTVKLLSTSVIEAASIEYVNVGA